MTDAPRWAPPDQIDEYRLIRPLGQGGMGHVYVAHDTLLDRPVAIKFIAAIEPDRLDRERLLVEARAIARLHHPNVVAIYRVGETAGRPFLVYELVRGQPLHQISVPLDWRRVLELGIGLARGLAAAHRRNVLHRDVKASNAVLADDGEVKLLDFGLAKLLDGAYAGWRPDANDREPARAAAPPSSDDTPVLPTGETLSSSRTPSSQLAAALTSPGAQVGTPHYMAPEIWNGHPATTRSDVYSLGVLLYYLCVGAPPHLAADRSELAVRVTTTDAPFLGHQLGDIDPELAAVVARCLARDPVQRPASGDELREALERLRDHGRIAAIPEGNPYRGLRPFEAEHRALFFGRDADARAVIERLRSEPWVLVAGDSGVGKSSLCRAGVLPRIVDGALDPDRSWASIVVVPGRHPADALATALAPHLGVSHDDFTAGLADARYLRSALLRQPAKRGCVIFIDQIEELVTNSDGVEARVFAEAIGELATRLPGVVMLASVRGDFVTRLATLPGIAEHIARGFHLVRPLTPEGVAEAVVGPARAAGFAFESATMPAELAASISIAEGGLPLLQFALAELWDARDPVTRQIPLAALDRIGGVTGALARHADTVIASLPQADRQAARTLLLALLTSENTRARRSTAELVEREPRAIAVLEVLVRGRLVVARDLDGGPVYELAHEALIKSWSMLRSWIDEDAGRRAIRERIAAAAAEWERTDHATDALWPERRLGELPELEPGALGERVRRFVTASQRAVARRRRIRRLTVAAVLAISAAVVTSLIALNHQSSERLGRLYEEQGRQALLSGDAMRAVVSLNEAYRNGARTVALRFMLAQGFRELGSLEASLRGHRGRVWSVAFSPDGSQVVTAGDDSTARLWDSNGTPLHTLEGHSARVLGARFSPDGSLVATASYDWTARLWDAHSGAQRCTMKHPAPVHAIEFSPDGSQATTAATDGVARIWNTRGCALVHELAPPDHVHRIPFQPAALVAYDSSGSRIAVWNDRGAVTLWDTQSGQLLRAFDGHRGFMFSVAFAPDGSRVVAAFDDGAVAIFDVATGRELLSLSGHRGTVTTAQFRSDGKQVLTTSDDGTARVWDAMTGALQLSLEHPGLVRSARWSPDSLRIVTTDSDGGVRSYESPTGRLDTSFLGHVDEAWAVVFDPRGERFATASTDGTAKIWNARWTRHLRTYGIELDVNRMLRLRGDMSAAFSPNGAIVVTTGGHRPEVHLWDRETGRSLATFVAHPGGTESAEFDRDGRRLVTCGRDRTVKLWNADTLGLEQTFHGHRDWVAHARFSPDGAWLVSASYDQTAIIWNVATGQSKTLRHVQPVLDARFSPDGTRIVTAATDHLVRIWDVNGSGEPLLLAGHTDKIISAMFSPDGRQVLSASGDKTARLWDARSGAQLRVLEGHKAEVLEAAFSPDGALIATASLDATLRVWDMGGRTLMMVSQPSPLMSVTWSPDSRYLLTTAADGSSRLWNGELESRSPEELEARLHCRVPFRLEQEHVVTDTRMSGCP